MPSADRRCPRVVSVAVEAFHSGCVGNHLGARARPFRCGGRSGSRRSAGEDACDRGVDSELS
eukprot:CAMPEP_0172618848 /NCGR_PEP_ID=MMETSP1068-20121228/86703_1 /TAXON_ID=35684 /ORGANISM="Pseudopedinella elastica, Strain CCMP716" /LENGTH=61 /DNA_ID=CAMNT_0013425305 /DNA_START=143 /DNA_END=326 /DNA_ORIENTATION=-